MRNLKSFRFTSWLSEFTFFRLTPHRSKAKIPTYRDALRLSVFFLSLSPLLLSTPAVVNAQWEPDQRLTYNDSASLTSGYGGSDNNGWSIAAGPGSVVHVVWQDKRDGVWEIYYKRSSDAGSTWSPDTRFTYTQGFTMTPSICVVDSVVHVVWSNYDTSSPYEIYYKRSSDGGDTWSPNTRLTYNIYESDEPSVAAADSNVHVVWKDSRVNGNEEIYYKRSTDSGITWSPDSRLTYNIGGSFWPSVAVSNNAVHVVWSDDRSGDWEIYYKRSTNGGLSWGPDTCLTLDPFTSAYASVATSGAHVHVLWRDSRDGNSEIYYKHSTDRGVSWSQDIRLTDDPARSNFPSVAALGTMIHVVWQDLRDGNYEIYYKRSADNGFTWSPDTRLTSFSDSSNWPSVAVFGPIVHVVWYDRRDGNDEIYYKRNPTGSGIEVPFTQQTINSPILFSFHPNPFTFFTALPGHGNERFMLYDISGRRVGTYRGDRVGADLAPGVYFLRPEGNKDAKPVRVVKLR